MIHPNESLKKENNDISTQFIYQIWTKKNSLKVILGSLKENISTGCQENYIFLGPLCEATSPAVLLLV